MSLPPDTPRVGIGWDRHLLAKGRRCVLGGVPIESAVGPVGHSDGDAVLHALTDALLGAAGLGDLGSRFPDSDPRWKGADSLDFLRDAVGELQSLGLRAASADVVVVCDEPKIGPHRERICATLAAELGLPAQRVNVKGKTSEGAAADRIEATAVVLVVSAPAARPGTQR